MNYKKTIMIAFAAILLSACTITVFAVSSKKESISISNNNTMFAAGSLTEQSRSDAPDNAEREFAVSELSPVATEPPAENAIADKTSSVIYAETTVFVTTPEESKQNAEYEAEVSRQAQEEIDSVIAQFGNRQLRDDVDVEKMIRSKITERQSDLECVVTDYEEYKKTSGVQTDASFEEEIARIKNAVLAQETILEDYLAGRISREEAHNRSINAAFTSQFDVLK